MTWLKLLVNTTGRSEEEIIRDLALGTAVAVLRAADSLLEVWPLPLPVRRDRE